MAEIEKDKLIRDINRQLDGPLPRLMVGGLMSRLGEACTYEEPLLPTSVVNQIAIIALKICTLDIVLEILEKKGRQGADLRALLNVKLQNIDLDSVRTLLRKHANSQRKVNVSEVVEAVLFYKHTHRDTTLAAVLKEQTGAFRNQGTSASSLLVERALALPSAEEKPLVEETKPGEADTTARTAENRVEEAEVQGGEVTARTVAAAAGASSVEGGNNEAGTNEAGNKDSGVELSPMNIGNKKG